MKMTLVRDKKRPQPPIWFKKCKRCGAPKSVIKQCLICTGKESDSGSS